MKHLDEEDWKRSLRAIDQPLSFDAQAFAQRVIGERSQRRKQRVRAGYALVALMAIGLAYGYFQTTAGKVTVSEPSLSDMRRNNASSTGSKSGPKSDPGSGPEYLALQRIQEIDSQLASLDHQGRRWRGIANRVRQIRAALATAQKEQQQQQFTMLRAEQSHLIKIPDLTDFYVERSENISK